MFQTVYSLLIPLFLFVVFCILTLGTALNSLWSGWNDLEKKFKYKQSFRGKYFWFQPVAICRLPASAIISRYQKGLKIGLNRSGIYLAPALIERPIIRPILIPWREIIGHYYQEFYHREKCYLKIKSFPEICIQISPELFDQMRPFLYKAKKR